LSRFKCDYRQRRPVIITNGELWKQTNKIKITEQITRRKWNWIGHTPREQNAREPTRIKEKRKAKQELAERTIREEALAAGKT
jgi:hypothetical protein